MRRPRLHVLLLVASLVAMAIPLTSAPASAATSVGFGNSSLSGASSEFPTSLQFGPDGRLYVAHMNGTIRVYTIDRTDRDRYTVIAPEPIARIATIANHDDRRTALPDFTGLSVRGDLVARTWPNAVISMLY